MKQEVCMLVACALKAEAQPLAQAMGLRGAQMPGCPHAWSDRDGLLWIVSSGVGRVAQAAVTAAALAALRGSSAGPLRVVNAGLAGAEDPSAQIGAAHQVVAVCEQASGRHFYPDLIWQLEELPPAEVVTLDRPQPVMKGASKRRPSRLYDMEASGFWQACQLQVPCDSIQSVKVVSDFGIAEDDPLPFAEMNAAWRAGLADVQRFIRAFQSAPEPQRAELPEALVTQIGALSERWRLTWAQRVELERILLRRVLQGFDDAERLEANIKEAAPGHARERDHQWRLLCHDLSES